MKTLDDAQRFSHLEQDCAEYDRIIQQDKAHIAALKRAMNGGTAGAVILQKIQQPQPQGLNRKQRRMNAKKVKYENA
jgi:hypothetical protein